MLRCTQTASHLANKRRMRKSIGGKKSKAELRGGRGGATKQSTIKKPAGAAKSQRGRGGAADPVEVESEADEDEEDEEEKEDIESRVRRTEQQIDALLRASILQVDVARQLVHLKAGLRQLGREEDIVPDLPVAPMKGKPAAKATAAPSKKVTTRKTAVAVVVPAPKVTKPAPRKTATARKARGSIVKAAEVTGNIGSGKAAKQTTARPASAQEDKPEADESQGPEGEERNVGVAGVEDTSLLSDPPDESILGGRQALDMIKRS